MEVLQRILDEGLYVGRPPRFQIREPKAAVSFATESRHIPSSIIHTLHTTSGLLDPNAPKWNPFPVPGAKDEDRDPRAKQECRPCTRHLGPFSVRHFALGLLLPFAQVLRCIGFFSGECLGSSWIGKCSISPVLTLRLLLQDWDMVLWASMLLFQ